MNPKNNTKNYLPVIVALRGSAAVAVCLFHFTKGYANEDGLLRALFSKGWMGVEVFFVISGFVIPFSLLGSSFRIRHYFKFMKKRFLRIEPAYIISVLLVVALNYLASLVPGFAGEPFSVSIGLLFQHFGYLVGLFGNEWLSPVYWTLEIEFHYYLIIGVLIALWNLRHNWLTISSILLVLLLSFWKQDVIPFFKYIDIFVLGILTAFYKREQIQQLVYLLLSFALACVIFSNHGMTIAALTFVTGVLIAFFSHWGNTKILLFCGNISYSLYLLHVPIGGRVINLFKRLELSEISKFGVVLLALLFSIFAAWLFYKFVEKPSHQWAKKVKFN